jgi:hypothetical protein
MLALEHFNILRSDAGQPKLMLIALVLGGRQVSVLVFIHESLLPNSLTKLLLQQCFDTKLFISMVSQPFIN